VKCQSDLVIAGFLRNIFKYDVYTKFMRVQHELFPANLRENKIKKILFN